MDPIASVIIPVYNGEAYIGQAIKSILNQTVNDVEVLVVDDASTDNTPDLVAAFKDPRVRLIRHERNKGPAAARNSALDVANGKWVAVNDADDAWLPSRLEKLLLIAAAHPGDFVADDIMYCIVGRRGELIPFRTGKDGHLARNNRLASDRVGQVAAVPLPAETFVAKRLGIKPLIPMEAVRRHGIRFPEDVPYAEDFMFWMDLYRHGMKGWFYPEPLYLYRLSPNSLSTRPDRVHWESTVLARLLEKEGFSQSVREALQRRLVEVSSLMAYIPFSEALKRRRWGDACKIAVESPRVLTELARRLPDVVKLRFTARRLNGKLRRLHFHAEARDGRRNAVNGRVE